MWGDNVQKDSRTNPDTGIQVTHSQSNHGVVVYSFPYNITWKIKPIYLLKNVDVQKCLLNLIERGSTQDTMAVPLFL